jgi:hypothetical protein
MKKEVRGLTHPVELFNKSVSAVRNNWEIFTLLYILPAMLTLGNKHGQNFESRGFHGDLSGNNIEVSARGAAIISLAVVLFALIIIAVAALYQAMLYNAQLQAARGKVSVAVMWQTAKKYWGRLFLLLVVMGVTIGVGFLLFIIPGLFLLRMFFLAPYYLIDQDLGVFEALRKSARESKAISSYIWGVLGIIFLISLPGLLSETGALVSLILLLGYSVAPAILYNESKRASK